MNLMELYKTMSDINSIPKIDRNIMEQLLHSDGIAMSSTDKEGVTHILIKSFVILFWRNTSDSKVVTSLDFSPSLVMHDEEQLRAGMTPMHRHDYIEIAYVAKGEFSQLIAGEKRTFSQGSICIIDKNSEHADFIKNQDNFVIFICMKEGFFDELFLAELDDNNVQQFIRRALMKQKSLRQFLQFTPRDEQDVLFPLIEQVAKEKFENRKGAKYIIKGLIIRIFDILTRDYDINLTSTQLKRMNELLYSEVEEYLRKNYKDASLKELTKRFHFQQDYFARLVKKHAGITFSELLRKIRISKAEELLVNTRMPVTSIIESVGYENRHHFYNIFFELNNMTPEQYRQKHWDRSQDVSE